MNPRKMKPYIRAYEIKIEHERDDKNAFAYLQGIYFRDALLSTVGNMFSGKNGKKFEYPDKPYEFYKKHEEEHELTEEEKIQKTNELFLKLNIMKSNFDLAKN